MIHSKYLKMELDSILCAVLLSMVAKKKGIKKDGPIQKLAGKDRFGMTRLSKID